MAEQRSHEERPNADERQSPQQSVASGSRSNRGRRGRYRGTLAQQEQRLAYILLGPPVAIILAAIIFPVVWNVWLAFHEVKLLELQTLSWFEMEATLQNFVDVVTHYTFAPSLRATLIYTIGGALFSLILGLAAAEMVRSNFRGKGVIRGLFLIPYISPIVAVTFAWRFLLDPQGAIMTGLLETNAIQQPIHLLGERPWAMVSLVAFEAWRYFPFDFLFILARLQAIPKDLYEAATVDGASPLQKFVHVTLPQLKLVIAVLILLRVMWNFNKFDDAFLLTGGNAGTKVLPILVYDFLIGQFNVGMGAATALVLFAVLGIMIILYFRFVMRRAEEG